MAQASCSGAWRSTLHVAALVECSKHEHSCSLYAAGSIFVRVLTGLNRGNLFLVLHICYWRSCWTFVMALDYQA